MRVSEKRGQEETAIHSRMLRIGLVEQESRIYWSQAQREIAAEEKVRTAFEERWFGSRTMARVRYLVTNLEYRFDAFPGSLKALSRWNPTDICDRTVICHWHTQLCDPLYREFTSSVFGARWLRPQPTIDRTSVIRWVDEKMQGRWSSSTTQRMASGLLSCACEAGLCEKRNIVRNLSYPRVSNLALGYLLYLLKETRYEGNLRENPYTLSVGIGPDVWAQKVQKLPWLKYQSMSDVHDLKWEYDSLEQWAEEVFPA